MDQLNSLYEIHADACIWLLKYLSKHRNLITDVLLDSHHNEVREAFRHLLETAISMTAKNEESIFFEKYQIVDLKDDEVVAERVNKSALLRFMKGFFVDNLDKV